MRVSLNPVVGKQQQGDARPVLVLSSGEFNQTTGLAMVAPITQGGNLARFAGFAVPLTGSGCETQRVALVNMTRSVDLVARGAKKIETAPSFIVDDALARLIAIFE